LRSHLQLPLFYCNLEKFLMARKSTYEELEQRNKELEKEAVNCKRTEEALQESEKRLKNVTNSIEELLVLLDQNFKVQLINSTLAKAYNVSLDEYKGKHCYELFYGCKHICEGCPAIKVLNEGKVTRAALRYRPDGRIYDRTAYPFIEDNGDITGVIVIGCDITQQKQAEEKQRESEELLRGTIESTADGILVVNEKGQVICTNERFVQLWRIPEELIRKREDKRLLDFVLNQLKEPKAFLSKVQALYKTLDEDFDVINFKDGRVFERFSSPLIRDGQIAGRVWSFRDISERKRAEEALRESEKKYRSLLETTSQGYWMIDPGLKNIEVNPSLCNMLGYLPDEMLGKTPFYFVDDENREIFIEQFSKISTISHRSYEIILKKKNGQDLNTFINATTIRDESGEVQGAFALITDITDMKQTEQRLKQREKELEIKNIRLEEMNTALNILLKKRDEDKKELEEKVMTNIKELVFPYVTKLKNTGLNHTQEVFADIIQSNMEEIISPFAYKLSHKYLNFTPTELKVANLVKQGLRTKEIAKLLNSSPETITRHRKSMRKKLKLTDKKSNLRTHLLSLANGYIE
jgi:PAS domain S-box-containing protein